MTIANRGCAVIACLLMLAGCATRVPYSPPVTGKTATLTITSALTSGSIVVSTFADSEACTGEQVIASSRTAGTPSIGSKTRIPADRPFSLWVKQSLPGKQCHVMVTFDPAHTRSYEAVLDRDATHCGVSIIDTSGPLPVVEPSTRRLVWSPSRGSGPSCKPGPAVPENGIAADGNKVENARREGKVTLDDLKHLLPAK